MRTIYRILLCFFAVIITGNVYAQQFTVKASIDSTLILIGKQSHLSFEIAQPKNARVQFPLFSDTVITGVNILGKPRMDTIDLGHERIQVKQTYTITSFDTALYYIPSFKLVAGRDTFKTNPLSIKVITYNVDTAKQSIYDIKKIYSAPFNWKMVFLIVLIILLIIIVLAAVVYVIWKYILKKPIPFIEKLMTPLLPYQKALKELDHISSQKLWQHGREKEFYTRLTEVIRVYIEARFNIQALEMTSAEILDEAQMIQTEYPAAYDSLRKLLQVSDLAKFAQWHPLAEENELSLNICYLFVNQTKLEETPVTEEPVSDDQKTTRSLDSDKKNS
jgi:hypothetical protein